MLSTQALSVFVILTMSAVPVEVSFELNKENLMRNPLAPFDLKLER